MNVYSTLSVQERRRHQYPTPPVPPCPMAVEPTGDEPLPPRVRRRKRKPPREDHTLTGSQPPVLPSPPGKNKIKPYKGQARINTVILFCPDRTHRIINIVTLSKNNHTRNYTLVYLQSIGSFYQIWFRS